MGGRRAAKQNSGSRPTAAVLAALSEAVEGLTYPSESDAPFDVFLDEHAASAEEVVASRARGGKSAAVPVEQFFAELEGVVEAERFRHLRKVLEEHLSPLKVFRVGSVKVDLYIVGKTRGGAWAGLHTTSVET